MQTDLATLFYAAQDHYLSDGEITNFKHQIDTLRLRVEVYECLRDREIEIFQPIANYLEEAFAQENPQVLEQALKHWLSVVRYSAFATLLNNPEYLKHRLLEWLTDIVAAHKMQEIETYLYEFLQLKLSEILTQDQLALLNPFLELAKETLFNPTHTIDTDIEATI
ncbi:conserved hypothetical protein [Gloeothece citriformis PCC 7424]|uniref:Phycobilisome protein n=1 Tax=Gloeothece citriformis (strain PCC 7424) TaxID=65393 RepID=B7KJU6_GLOC7|nr:phycobilisome protein [Gloeothece citriformis]ACK69545.1 conserved hypothetical protein [Gloeothece citriformis PCC 7424]